MKLYITSKQLITDAGQPPIPGGVVVEDRRPVSGCDGLAQDWTGDEGRQALRAARLSFPELIGEHWSRNSPMYAAAWEAVLPFYNVACRKHGSVEQEEETG
jgi:hypothetical protein